MLLNENGQSKFLVMPGQSVASVTEVSLKKKKKKSPSLYLELNSFATILKDSLPLWLQSPHQPSSSQSVRKAQDELLSDNAKTFICCGKS